MSERQRKLMAVKLKLAEKYEHLSRITGSKVKRRTYTNRADAYRRQAAVLSSTLEQ